jgi:hypothetical protein
MIEIRFALMAVIAVLLLQVPAVGQPEPGNAQIRLTEGHIESYLAAVGEVAALVKIYENKKDSEGREKLEKVATKHGFKNFNEYDDVDANIVLVLLGVDPRTKIYTDPAKEIKEEIARAKADKSIPPREKKQMLDDLNSALKGVVPVRYPTNIALVLRHYDRIDAAQKLITE